MDKSAAEIIDKVDLMTLVKMVENRPCIWKKSCNSDLEERKRAWREICQHFTPMNLNEMDTEEQTNLERYLAGRWKNLRVTFTKMAKKRCGHLHKYYKNLKFLIENRHLKSEQEAELDLNQESPVEVSENKESSSAKCIKRMSPLHTNLAQKRRRSSAVPNSIEVLSLTSSSEEFNQASSPPETPSSSVNSMPELLKKNNNNFDEDEAFFISIMPCVRKFSEEDKLEFRIGVLSTMKEVCQKSKLKSMSSSSNMPCGDLLFISENDFSQNSFLDVKPECQ